jgi:hypothetical protein
MPLLKTSVRPRMSLVFMVSSLNDPGGGRALDAESPWPARIFE